MFPGVPYTTGAKKLQEKPWDFFEKWEKGVGEVAGNPGDPNWEGAFPRKTLPAFQKAKGYQGTPGLPAAPVPRKCF